MKLAECLQMEFFKREGFTRRKCPRCSSYFWSRTPGQKMCGDSPCVEYSFIGNSQGKKSTLEGMREKFLSFFEKQGHTRLDPYPVVARWRDDIYLTIASIADFQPHVTSGLVPPPANPLVISQPSIRLNDLDSVGRSGRHLTLFEMMGHHAFNNHGWVYWTEETTEYCHDFLRSLRIPPERVTYKEAEWYGGGNAGPCLEVLADGLELATLVFMNLQEKSDGPYTVQGVRYGEMPLKVVDTGYGLERLVWITQGSPTVYDAIFPRVITLLVDEGGIERNDDLIGESSRLASLNLTGDPFEHLEDRLRKRGISLTGRDCQMLRDMKSIYTVSDHARCLGFLLGDGIVPSNVGAGYLARLVIRRGLRLLSLLKSSYTLGDLVCHHLDSLVKDFPALQDSRDRILEILEIEAGKYRDTLERGRRLIQRELKEKKTFTESDLVNLYDTHGLSPGIVKEFAEGTATVVVPPNFDSMIADRHGRVAEEQKKVVSFPGIETRFLFYDRPDDKEFDAWVLWRKQDKGTGHLQVILDQTLFYPEGGGQPSDTGYLWVTPKQKHRVLEVYKGDRAIVHVIEGTLRGNVVHGEIDWDRRHQIMCHHTSTHIINAAARTVLGDHIWQAGSQVDEKEARLDVTHYKHITVEECLKIEQVANKIIRDDVKVNRMWLDRLSAEKQFGFHLYQGGAPKGNMLRVIEIPGFEVEACGGTHVSHTGDIGIIKITGIEHIQDGVQRLRFSARDAALQFIQKQEGYLLDASSILGVEPSQLPRTVTRFFEEWKTQRKELERLRGQTAGSRAAMLVREGEHVGDVTLVASIEDCDMKGLISLAGQLTKQGMDGGVVAVVGNREGQLVISRSPNLTIDCRMVIREVTPILGGSGGGKPDLAQGGGPHKDRIDDALTKAIQIIKKIITN